MTHPDIKLSLRNHFGVCAVGFMGASAGFALSGGNPLAAALTGLSAAGMARSYAESRLSGQDEYERPSIWNVRSYLKDAPRSSLKKFNDAAVVCLATVAGGAAGAVIGYQLGAPAGLLALPFTIATGTGMGGFAGWVAGHVLRFPAMGAVSVIDAAVSCVRYVAGGNPAFRHSASI